MSNSNSVVVCSLIHSFWYAFFIVIPHNSYWDLVLPITIIRWLLSYVSGINTIMVCVLYSVIWFFMTSLGFLLEQVKLIRHGTTSFEEDNKIKITNSNSVSDNIRGVFGRRWLWNFILPLHQVYQEFDDGVNWHNVKVWRRHNPSVNTHVHRMVYEQAAYAVYTWPNGVTPLKISSCVTNILDISSKPTPVCSLLSLPSFELTL